MFFLHQKVPIACAAVALLFLLPAAGWGEESQARLRVEHCLQEMTSAGIFLNSLQGGYYQTPSPSLNIHGFSIPIYREKSDFVSPSADTPADELRQFLGNTIPHCLSQAQFGGSSGKDVRVERITKVELGEDYVAVSANYSVRLPENQQTVADSVSTRVPSPYRRYHQAMGELIKLLRQDPDVVPFSDLVAFAEKHQLKITYSEAPEDFRTILYALEDESSVNPSGGSYRFVFAIKYPW